MLTRSPESDARTSLRPPAVILAAACMASAGLVHAAAAGAHNDDYTVATLFAITAVVQLGWAALVLQRPTRLVFALGALLGFGAVTFWAVTKVWGIGFIDGLAGNQPADFQDSVATVLELIAGGAALRALWHPVVNDRRTMLVSRVAVVLGALALVAAVPASAAPHSHDHADGAGHDDVAGDHAHGGGSDHANVDGSMTIAGYTYEHADITQEQHKAAEALVIDTRAALAATDYASYDAAVADGYVSIRDQITGHEHVVHAAYVLNDNVLDPEEIESLVYEVKDDGSKVLVSAMYLMPPDTTMGDQPDVAGEITKWHDHQNLCWDETGRRIAGILVNGKCFPGGTLRATSPMLHVWVTDHPCGPFAGIEGGGHGESCDHADSH